MGRGNESLFLGSRSHDQDGPYMVKTLNYLQGFSWTEIYFGHFVQAAPILFGHLEIF